MLYLVCGPARSGKSLLAARLLRDRGVPYLPLDYLTSGLAEGAPGLGVRHECAAVDRARRMWPVVAPLLRNIVEVEPRYLVEGEALLPAHVAELMGRHPGLIRPCFLGYAHRSIDEKCAAIRGNPSPINDWVRTSSDTELRTLVAEMREFSALLEAECARLGLRYIDEGAVFCAGLERAWQHLTAAD